MHINIAKVLQAVDTRLQYDTYKSCIGSYGMVIESTQAANNSQEGGQGGNVSVSFLELLVSSVLYPMYASWLSIGNKVVYLSLNY